MTDLTLREQIATLISYDQDLKRPLAMVEATDGNGNWIDRREVLALIDAHPAPPAISEADGLADDLAEALRLAETHMPKDRRVYRAQRSKIHTALARYDSARSSKGVMS